MTKIEEVAQAISDSLSGPDKCGAEMCYGQVKFCACAMDAAKDAIKAMREPTQKMKLSGLKPYIHNVAGMGEMSTPAGVYEAMITAALEEE